MSPPPPGHFPGIPAAAKRRCYRDSGFLRQRRGKSVLFRLDAFSAAWVTRLVSAVDGHEERLARPTFIRWPKMDTRRRENPSCN